MLKAAIHKRKQDDLKVLNYLKTVTWATRKSIRDGAGVTGKALDRVLQNQRLARTIVVCLVDEEVALVGWREVAASRPLQLEHRIRTGSQEGLLILDEAEEACIERWLALKRSPEAGDVKLSGLDAVILGWANVARGFQPQTSQSALPPPRIDRQIDSARRAAA